MGARQFMSEDKINHPKHYTSSEAKCECGRQIECIDITRHMNFNIGNVVKYLWRASLKNGLEDLKKAQWYLNDAVRMAEQQSTLTGGADIKVTCEYIKECQHMWNVDLSPPYLTHCIKCGKLK